MALTRIHEHQVDTSTMGIDDAITTLNELQTGVNTADIGFVMNRGVLGNVGMIWNEENKVFRFIQTAQNGLEQITTVNIGDNAPVLTGVQFVSTGNFNREGDARAGVYMQRNETTGLALTQLYSDGDTTDLVITPNSVWTYEILLTAKRIDTGSDAASFKIIGAVGRNDSLASVFLVGTPSSTVIGRTDSVWDATVGVDATTGALVIKVHGSLGKTIRWVAKIMTLEVAFNI